MWDAGEQVQRHGDDIKELQDSDRDLYEFVRALAAQNEILKRELQHERELRTQDLAHLRQHQDDKAEKLELRLRLQIAEELRRLPPPE